MGYFDRLSCGFWVFYHVWGPVLLVPDVEAVRRVGSSASYLLGVVRGGFTGLELREDFGWAFLFFCFYPGIVCL